MVRQGQIHWVKLRYGVQRTDSGARKERCPSRGIAFEFCRPLAMFPACKHLRSIYRDVCHAMAQKIRCKNSVFCDRMTTKDIDNNQKDNTMKKIIYLALIAVIMGFLPINEQQQIFLIKKCDLLWLCYC